MAETHDLRTVADFFAIPAEKREACLRDFALWLEVLESLGDLFAGVHGIRQQRDVFRWIDDAKHDAVLDVAIRSQSDESATSAGAVDPVDGIVEG